MTNEIFNPFKKYSENNDVETKEEMKEKKNFIELNLDDLVPFKNQPFRLYSNEEI